MNDFVLFGLRAARVGAWRGLNRPPETLSRPGVYPAGRRTPGKHGVVASVTYCFDVSPVQGIWDFSAGQRDRKPAWSPPGHGDPHWDLLSCLSPLASVCQQGSILAEVAGGGGGFLHLSGG